MAQTAEALIEENATHTKGVKTAPKKNQAVHLSLDDLKPAVKATPEEILTLAAKVYEGWSKREIEEFEAIILDRSNFRKGQN